MDVQRQKKRAPPPPPPPKKRFGLNRPCKDLLTDDRRKDYIDICVPLYKASTRGDWKAAKRILQNDKRLVRYSITENDETALHVAASAKSTTFMEGLVKIMEVKDLELQTKTGDTALYLAAASGDVKMASILVAKNENLLTISGSEGLMPLSVAALHGNGDMVKYLYKPDQLKSPDWTASSRQWLLLKCIEVNLFDIALKVLEDQEKLGEGLGLPSGCDEKILELLAKKPSAFNESKSHSVFTAICKPAGRESKAMQLLKKVWAKTMARPKADIDKILKGPTTLIKGIPKYPSHILFVATKMGNTEFVVALIREYPELMWKKNEEKQSIFHIAVSHRREKIYNLLHEIGSMKDLITRLRDTEQNNMLHLVGKNAHNYQHHDVSGVAFQMQRELQWFKEVKSMIPPNYIEEKNKAGVTPYELFTENHKTLVSKGEKWMKGTASQCMVVAALIATVVFAVAFTIPGGYNQNNGLPVFLWKGHFIVFVLLDAVSFILSSTSILVFLSILTSRYSQEDFLESLPRKLLIGLTTLFLSIMTMMMAFSVSFFVLYHEQLIAIAISISIFAVIPIIAFAILHYRLLMDVFHSTRTSRLLFQPKKQLLFYQNPKF